ncbi:MAG: hypothetical protein Q8Q32_01445 [bacterium]|nr:hypothetical protein [bacterium]
MKDIETGPKELRPEQIEEIIDDYRPLLERIEQERKLIQENIGADLHQHILGNAGPLLREENMRFMLKDSDQWMIQIQQSANALERYFRLLDENPELSQKIKVEGWEAFPKLKESGVLNAFQLIDELESIAQGSDSQAA